MQVDARYALLLSQLVSIGDGVRCVGEQRDRIWFSLPQAAYHCLASAGFAAFCFYLSWKFIFDLADLSNGGGRRRWFLSLLKSGDGWVGAALFAACASAFLWWAFRAGWRFFTSRAAATISGGYIRLYRLFGPALDVHVSNIEEVKIYKEVSSKLLGLIPPIHTLRLRWTDDKHRRRRRRQMKIRDNTIEGGQAALEAFASSLQARGMPE